MGSVKAEAAFPRLKASDAGAARCHLAMHDVSSRIIRTKTLRPALFRPSLVLGFQLKFWGMEAVYT